MLFRNKVFGIYPIMEEINLIKKIKKITAAVLVSAIALGTISVQEVFAFGPPKKAYFSVNGTTQNNETGVNNPNILYLRIVAPDNMTDVDGIGWIAYGLTGGTTYSLNSDYNTFVSEYIDNSERGVAINLAQEIMADLKGQFIPPSNTYPINTYTTRFLSTSNQEESYNSEELLLNFNFDPTPLVFKVTRYQVNNPDLHDGEIEYKWVFDGDFDASSGYFTNEGLQDMPLVFNNGRLEMGDLITTKDNITANETTFTLQRESGISISGNTASVTVTEIQPTPVTVIDGGIYNPSNTAKAPTPAASETPSTDSGYIYGTIDPGASVNLPLDQLNTVTDTSTAVSAINTAASGLTSDQSQSPTGIDLVTLYAEGAISRASTQAVTGNAVNINADNLSTLQLNAANTKSAAEQALTNDGLITQREINADVAFSAQPTDSLTITFDPTAANTTADNVQVTTGDYTVSLSKEDIAANTADGPFVITVTEQQSLAALNAKDADLLAMAPASYGISTNKPFFGNMKFSTKPADGDYNTQTILDENNTPVGGKYNPVEQKITANISKGGTYITKQNKKDFSDIQNKSSEMQNAIRILSSKGIINGTGASTFSPNSPISRAEIAQLITKTLSMLNPNENGGFKDVKSSDWFFGAAGSAKKHGIMAGTSSNTFSPNTNIPKDQIVAVSARVLKTKMRYKDVTDTGSYLSKYKDSSSIADWARGDVALATKLGMVVYRTDGKFAPTGTMTRGDAAIILYRMFQKIW